MPLQIRRGPTADRLSIVPLLGELVYDTNTGSVFIGDGVTPGGVPITQLSAEDVRNITAGQFLGPFIDDNTIHTGITFQYVDNRLVATVSDSLTGNFSGNFFSEDSTLIIDGRTGTVSGNFVGNVWADDSTGPLINGANGSINLDGTVKGNVIPDQSEAYNLGSAFNRFKDLYLSGSSLWLGDAQLTAQGTSIILPSGSTIDGNPLGFELGQEYAINIRGDLRGSVFPDDSTAPTNPEDPDDSTRTRPLVDATEGSINLDGTVKGNVIPDQTETRNIGSLIKRFNKLYLTESNSSLWIGNAAIGATGTAIDLPAGSTVGGIAIGSGTGTGDGVVEGSNYKINIVSSDSTLIVDSDNNLLNGNLTGNVFGNLTGDVFGNLTGDVNGNLTGYHTGDVKGSVFASDSSVMVDANDSRLSADEAVIATITTSLLVTPTIGTSMRLQGNNVNIITGGTAIFGNGNEDLNSNVYINRTLFTGTDVAGFTLNTSHGFTPDMDGFNFRRTRGPSSLPTAVEQFDVLGKIAFYGYNGTDYKQTMVIDNTADLINSTTVTSNLVIQSLDSNGNLIPRIRLLADGRLMLGAAFTTDVDNGLGGVEIFNTQYVENANAPGHPLVIRQYFDNVDSNNFNVVRNRGTRTLPTAILNQDKIFEITCLGNDGSATPALSSRVTFLATGAISTGVIPGTISFDTANTSGVIAPRVRVLQDGRMMVGPAFSTDLASESGGVEIFNTQYTAGANAAGQPLIIRQFFDNAESNRFTVVKNRGLRSAPTPILKDDKIFEFAMLGNDGSGTARLSSRITFFASETVSAGIIPGGISLDTADVTGTIRQRVQVRENGVLNALFGIQGDLTGSVFSDTSTMIIDGTSGSLMVANIDLVGNIGNTPLTPGTVDSWLQVSVNGNTKYIPLYV